MNIREDAEPPSPVAGIDPDQPRGLIPDDPSETHLSLWKKRLGRVPNWVWQKTGLETLVLAENELSEVSGQVGGLRRLRMLDLGHNRLTEVPDTLADLDALTDFLYLHDNRRMDRLVKT